MEMKKPSQPVNSNNLFDRATYWIGSKTSLIIHTMLFVGSFLLAFLGISIERILLVVTTLVSLEAIYLAIFIQMAVNRNTESLEEVEENLDEIQEDVQEMEKDVAEIQEDIDEIQEDVGEIEKDEAEDEHHEQQNKQVLTKIEFQLQTLISEIEKIKSDGNKGN